MSLRDRLLELAGGPRDDAALDAIALQLLAHQRAGCADYDRWCGQKIREQPQGWRDIPPLPVSGFSLMDLATFPEADTVATYLTSGTTTGRRGRHRFRDLSVYRATSMRSFQRALLPDGRPRTLISLVKPEDDSSLWQMIAWAIEQLGTSDSRVDETGTTLGDDSEGPLILGTAFGLATALERQPGLQLPENTLVMETGGFKGRRRELTRPELHELYARAGIRSANVVGEYGMTELSSQWYDAIAGRGGPVEERAYEPPPWARTRVLDPVTLTEVADGQVGLLSHFDPMNLDSVSAILTSDLGERAGDGFKYRGRATGAALRGCSLRDEGDL